VLATGRDIVRAGSKVYFNRLLERNAVPVIWTANEIGEMDPAFLRRMSFALEVKVPPRTVRVGQWRSIARRHGLALGDSDAETLAEVHCTAPSAAENAVATVALAGEDASRLGLVLTNLARVTGTRRARESVIAPARDIDVFNTDHDLAQIEASLPRLAEVPGVSFCFHGPAGTGKSAYARRLAELMNRTAMEKRGSDLLSKWIGGTEARIARAFDDAAAEGSVLIIDEAESLFWNRSENTRSWESSMVNEFLGAMDAHALPVICTTNHLSRIDPAIVRRFAFKVKFDVLTAGQREAVYARFFGAAAPVDVRELDGLALGDFATVRRKVRLLGIAPEDSQCVVGLLQSELAAKPHATRRMGF
jgi:SpoVK/Ycf46/Vps4 family AAA+-type ATPase